MSGTDQKTYKGQKKSRFRIPSIIARPAIRNRPLSNTFITMPAEISASGAYARSLSICARSHVFNSLSILSRYSSG